ncbi:anhydro-N-acetylmuramic acid kinase [Microlunatus panaciterrae]|uniref:Anhydro-N-acetylmuramic acid kinase n=1 Tax=Microlunatus panaciterrae TaxID=400768 RepID=A0ABS2RJD8_9ACTN|nr:anhydro-N-acetylmuramic acid kinase [Microlunatus panaciterrae]MBM7798783.1 anhydro-N-acetylmuramic acid kinase [Microlunatus panaciterrae]
MSAEPKLRVIGLMSGTSYDAIDAGVIDLSWDGDTVVLEPLGLSSHRYPEQLRAELAAVQPPQPATMEAVCRLDTLIGREFARAAAAALNGLAGGRADLVASHGQTVFHWVQGADVLGTLQIGQAAWIAEATALPVVSDFRARDVAAGGQGAPLVSLLDVLWLRSRPGNPVALNLGGIANITTGVTTDTPIAFDTGPANALLDAAITHFSDGREWVDVDGARAARGSVQPELLRLLLDDPYYRRPAPKSTGREHFHLPYLLHLLAVDGEVALDDLLATLTELTAATVADAVVEHGGTEVIASGGGTRNPTLMRRLAARLGGGVPVRLSDELGLPSEAKEAYAFALLGFLTLNGLPGTVPSCTGARRASVLGSITPGGRPLVLPPRPSAPPRALRIEQPPSGVLSR